MTRFLKISYPSYPIIQNQKIMRKNKLPLSYPILPYLTQSRVTWVREGNNKMYIQLTDIQHLGNLGKIFRTFQTYKKNRLHGRKILYC